MSNSHSGTLGRRTPLTGAIRRQHSVEWNHERKRGHLYGNTSSSEGGSSDEEGDRRLYGNTTGTGAVDNDFLAHLIAQTQQLTKLLPEDDRQYAAAAQGYRSAVDCDRNGFSTAAENGAGGGVSHDNGFDNHLPQQRQPFHSSSSSTLGMDKTNPFAALAHQQQQQLKSLNSPITANRQSPLQLRQASPFPHESTNSRRKHFPSNAATATTTTTATVTAASGVAQDISRKHRNNISTTNGGGSVGGDLLLCSSSGSMRSISKQNNLTIGGATNNNNNHSLITNNNSSSNGKLSQLTVGRAVTSQKSRSHTRLSGMTSSSSTASSTNGNSNNLNAVPKDRSFSARENGGGGVTGAAMNSSRLSGLDNPMDGLNIEDDEPPPEPAPPEIPPRGHSLLRSSSTSLRKCSDYQLHMRGEVVAAQKHEEFIPQEKQQGYFYSSGR